MKPDCKLHLPVASVTQVAGTENLSALLNEPETCALAVAPLAEAMDTVAMPFMAPFESSVVVTLTVSAKSPSLATPTLNEAGSPDVTLDGPLRVEIDTSWTRAVGAGPRYSIGSWHGSAAVGALKPCASCCRTAQPPAGVVSAWWMAFTPA